MRNTIFYRTLTIIFFTPVFQIVYSQQIILKGKVSNETGVLPAATISLNNKVTLSDSKGEFAFSVDPGRYILTVTHAGYKKMEKEIIISGDGMKNYFDLVLEPSGEMENLMLGSRSIRQRSSLNTAVPVDRIELSKLPARQVEITRIIENTIPSFTAAAHGFREGKQMLPASLRSLGPDHTLVLLNGRRMHTTASPWTFGVIGFGTVGVDLNAIPSASIATVEVLRDGAAAQYGSDAIGGVIDMQLKKSTGVTSIQLNTGQYYKGDGEAISFSVNHGFNFLKKGFMNLTGSFRFNDYTQRNGEYDSTVYYNIPENAMPAYRDSVRKLDNQKIIERGFDRKNHKPLGDNRVLNTGLSINGGYTLNQSTSLFWTVTGNYRFCKDISSNVYRYPNRDTLRINASIYPDGFLPYIDSRMPDINLIGGIQGVTRSGWHWDAGIIYGKNSAMIDVTNSNNASQEYTGGKYAPTSFYAGKQSFSQLTNNFNLSRDLSNKIKSVRSFNVAFGVEFRNDHYRIREGEEASWKNYMPAKQKESGSQGQAGFQPDNAINENRQVLGSYVEVEMEKNEKLLMNLATRYEFYSDFGSNLAGKLAIRYKFSNLLLWRGSISNGFRAPALQQRYYGLITTATRPTGLVRTGTFPNDHEVTKAFGIDPLEPEKAINLSTGLTSLISKNITVTIDGYWIQIRNRIIYSANIPRNNNPEVGIILDNAGFKDVQSARFFSNAINTRTKGLDLVVTGKWFIGNKSVIETSLAANYSETNLYDSILYAKNLPDTEKYRKLLVNREERCRVETAYPQSKMILNISYKIDKWRLNASFTRYGEIIQNVNDTLKNVHPTTYPDEKFSPKIVTSLNINGRVKAWLDITLGAENIFNVFPDKLKYKVNTQSGLLIYNPNFAPFGCNGGYYYINMSFNFLSNKKSHP